uniref:Glutathione synthetase, chloroplastic n=1 Tax=Lygus hesperus TaxID=30085 RepID=A0A0A9ZD61_LYGHE
MRVTQTLYNTICVFERRYKAILCNKKPQMLMVVRRCEGNSIELTKLKEMMQNQYSVHVFTVSLDTFARVSYIDASTNLLYISGTPIAVVYYRCAYTPVDFAGDAERRAYCEIEKSLAIKCPSIDFHLAGLKRVQQELSDAKVLGTYVSEDEAKQLRGIFVDMYNFTQPLPPWVVEEVGTRPTDFVIKPQREGGGNNIWGTGVSKLVTELVGGTEDASKYILMRIIPTTANTYSRVLDNRVCVDVCIHELGIFSAMLYDTHLERFYENTVLGYLLRTKPQDHNEGGVMTGDSVISAV